VRIKTWWWIVPVLLLMAAFGMHGLDADPIWNDEWYQMRDARAHNEPWEIAIHVAVQNPWHVPSYFILLNWWARLIGWHPFVTRMLALLIGMLAVAWTYRLGRDHVSPRVGLYAAFILALSEFFVHYLHETRMYTFTVLMAVFDIWLYLRVIRARREPGKWTWLLVWFAITLTLYTHYLLALLLTALGLYHLLFAPKNRRWWKVVAAAGLAGVAFLPWTVALSRVVGRAASRGLPNELTGPDLLGYVAYLFGNGLALPAIVLIALAVVAVFTWRGHRKRGAAAMVFLLVVIALLVIVVSLALTLFDEERTRYLVFSWGLLAVVTAIGLVKLGELLAGDSPNARRISTIALAAWLLVALLANIRPVTTAILPGSALTFPVHTVMRELHPLHSPGDYIVQVVPDDNERWRYTNITPFYIELERLAADGRALAHESDPAVQRQWYDTIMREIGPAREYVWVAYQYDPTPSPLANIAARIEERYAFCGTAVVREDWRLQIDEYARSPVCCHPDTLDRPPLVDYGNGLALAGLEMDRGRDGLAVHLSWQGANTLPPETYSVGLHVTDAEGKLIAQTDYGLPTDSFICQHPEIELGELAPGEYTLNVIVYDWRTGERLPGVVVASGETTDAAPLLTFAVTDSGDVIR